MGKCGINKRRTMKKTIELLRKRREALVEAIVAIDSQRWPNKSLEQARDVIDVVLNHSDDLIEASKKELTENE